jgi:hypothetical protein
MSCKGGDIHAGMNKLCYCYSVCLIMHNIDMIFIVCITVYREIKLITIFCEHDILFFLLLLLLVGWD